MRRGSRLIVVGCAWFALLAGAQAAAANVVSHGGPVAHSMNGVVVAWGPNVNSIYSNATSGDPGLIKYLAASSGSTGDIGGVLAQYMDTSGHNAANADTYGGQYTITPSVTSTTIEDSQIQTELVNQIQAGHLPRPSGNGLSTIYLVDFPAGDTECFPQGTQQLCSGSYFCAYHSSTALSDGTNVLYAVLPDNTNGPMTAGCGNAPTLFGDQTSYLSHEWSETITDPLGTAWWDASGNEIGDLCNQLMAAEGGFEVQQEWSNLNGACEPSEPSYSAPTASFVAPSSAQSGQQTSFDASSSSDASADTASMSFSGTTYSIPSGISSYQWDWGDGSSSAAASTATATHSYSAVGTYQVSLTVTNALGFQSTITHQIAVSTAQAPTATTGTATAVSSAGATLNGTVNPQNQTVSYQFAYGASATSLNQSTPLTAGPTGQTATAVSSVLSGLSPSTTYYYELKAVSGTQTYTGSVQSFTTSAAAPQTPTVTTGSASQITSSSALLNGSINPGGTQAVGYHFAYGTSSSNLNQSTAQTTGPSGTSTSPVSTTVTGLKTSTRYYFRLVVSSGSQTYSGAVQSFATTAAPPPAQIPVVTTGTASSVTSSSALLAGTINPDGSQPVAYSFSYGTSASSLTATTPQVSGLTGTTTVPVNATLGGLSASTTYYFKLVVSFGGTTYSGAVQSFTTSAAPPPPQIPIVATGGASQLTSSSASLAGTVNPDGPSTVSYDFSYGTSQTNLNQATKQVSGLSGTSAIAVNASVTGLKASTTYYFRLNVSFGGKTYSGSVASFKTMSSAAKAATGAPIRVASTAATISGTVNPNGSPTTYHFEYGISTAYGQSTPALSAGSGDSDVAELYTLAWLSPHTTYHYRLVAQNAGGTTVGNDATLTTGAALSHAPRFGFRVARRAGLRSALGGRLKVSFSCDAGCSAYFAVTIAPSPGRHGVPLTVTLARGTGHVARAGSGRLEIAFIPRLVNVLAHHRRVELLVSGYAIGARTTPTAPQLRPLTLVP